jgi:hypothetical protein
MFSYTVFEKMFSPLSSSSLPYHPTPPEKATGVGLIDAPTLILLDEAVLPPDSHLPLLNIVA